MKTLAAGLAGLLLAAAPTAALAGDAAVEAPIRTFVETFNKGDIKGAMATHVAQPVIMDEVAPHLWQGAGAFEGWVASLDADSKAKGIADQAVAVGDPTREVVSGGDAYVISPVVYTFKQKGVPMRQAAQFSFALKKVGADWKIAAWTWTGPGSTPAR